MILTAVLVVAVVGLALAVVVAVIRDPGSTPGDVAMAYELAWDRLDFESLWTLAGGELRDGLDRKGFVQAKRAAYTGRTELAHLAVDVAVEGIDATANHAVVRTRVTLRDHAEVCNVIQLARRSGSWYVVAYQLADDARSV